MLVAKVAVDWPAFYFAAPAEVQHAAGGRPDLVGKARVYDFWRNAITIIDTQHLWQVEVSPELLPELVLECKVTELKSDRQVPNAFWRQKPYWWHPPRFGKARYFISPDFAVEGQGPDGSTYIMAYDKTGQMLYVWHRDNF